MPVRAACARGRSMAEGEEAVNLRRYVYFRNQLPVCREGRNSNRGLPSPANYRHIRCTPERKGVYGYLFRVPACACPMFFKMVCHPPWRPQKTGGPKLPPAPFRKLWVRTN